MLDDVAPEGRLYVVTKEGSFRTVELIGDIRDEAAK